MRKFVVAGMIYRPRLPIYDDKKDVYTFFFSSVVFFGGFAGM